MKFDVAEKTVNDIVDFIVSKRKDLNAEEQNSIRLMSWRVDDNIFKTSNDVSIKISITVERGH